MDKEEQQLNEFEPETFPDRRIKLTVDNQGAKHTVALRGWQFALLTGLIVIGLALLVVFAFHSPQSGKDDKTSKLAAENRLLLEKLTRFETEIDSIKTVLDSVSVLNKPEPKAYPYYSGEKSDAAESQKVGSPLQMRLSNLDRELEEIKLRLSLFTFMDSPNLKFPEGFVSSGDGIPSIHPTFGRLTDGWGMRIHPITDELEFHIGLDIANSIGTPVYATADGIVIEARHEEGYGKKVLIRHAEGYETLYGHLYSYRVSVGEAVRKGQIIAMIGNTGFSTGPHLHYGISRNGEAVDPTSYLNRYDIGG